MLTCRFSLNNLPMSAMSVGASVYPAFSGDGPWINDKHAQCVGAMGPIPAGTYYVVDRKSGGWMATFDPFLKKDQWLALYAADELVDDVTFCEAIKRGQFRIHPAVGTGRSVGCITLPFFGDFVALRATFLGAKQRIIPNTDLLTYGRVVVK